MSKEANRVLSVLSPSVSEEYKQEFLHYVCSFPDSELKECYAEDYVAIANMLKRRTFLYDKLIETLCTKLMVEILPPPTVYDVGCGLALQHILFDECIAYVGIESCPDIAEPKFFRNNCKFIRGKFSEVLPKLELGQSLYRSTLGKSAYTAYGIANMSLAYLGTQEEMKLFDKAFSLKVVL